MTAPLDIAAIKARAEAATAGPWVCHLGRPDDDAHGCRCRSVLAEPYQGAVAEIFVDNGKRIADGGNDCPPEAEARANARFIAAAREDVPALVARVEALEAALRFADENARTFLAEMLDGKYFGTVERGDARGLREISQVARAALGGEP